MKSGRFVGWWLTFRGKPSTTIAYGLPRNFLSSLDLRGFISAAYGVCNSGSVIACLIQAQQGPGPGPPYGMLIDSIRLGVVLLIMAMDPVAQHVPSSVPETRMDGHQVVLRSGLGPFVSRHR